MKKILLFAILLLALPTVVDAKIKGYYRVSLEAVDIENTTKGTISNPENSAGFTTPTYCDSLVDIVFSFEPTHIDFSIKNESKSNIKIIWDDVIYMGGIQGNSVGVFHSGVKYNDRENTQTPTTIIKGSQISDIIIPKNSVSYSDYFSRWMHHYIQFGEDQLTAIKVLLPIEVSGVKYEYLFVFSVKWEDIKVKARMSGGMEYYITKR